MLLENNGVLIKYCVTLLQVGIPYGEYTLMTNKNVNSFITFKIHEKTKTFEITVSNKSTNPIVIEN
jgi:hypothetical protein